MVWPLLEQFSFRESLSDDKRLVTYIEQMKKEEEQQCRDIYQGKLEGKEVSLFLHEAQRG